MNEQIHVCFMEKKSIISLFDGFGGSHMAITFHILHVYTKWPPVLASTFINLVLPITSPDITFVAHDYTQPIITYM